MPVRCSVRLRRSISARRRRASAASPRLPADSRTRAASVQAGIERGSTSIGLVGGADGLGQLAVGLEVAGQHAPALGRRVLVAVELLAQRLDPLRPAGRPPGRS